MECSLDEYIRRAENNENFDNMFSVKTEDRERYEEDELMIDAEIEEDTEEVKTWRWPSSTNSKSSESDCQTKKEEIIIAYKPFVDVPASYVGYDLRDKITGLIRSEMPDIDSQNWRMMRPNINGQRPAGMPPLVPKCAKQTNRRYKKNKNFQNFKGNLNRGKFNNAGQNANNRHEKFFKNLNQTQNDKTVFNVTMPVPGLTAKKTFQTVKPQLDPRSNTIQNALNTNNQISQLGLYGIQNPQELNNDMLPQIAAKMLDLIKNNAITTTHKPMYDLSIHKEICELQQKPFLYKCGSNGVVSYDGPGIENLKIIPTATPLSLNCRFG